MTERNYIIGTGFYHAPDQREWAHWFFQHLWYRNTALVGEITPKILIIANGKCRPEPRANAMMITLNGNLGHVGQLLSGEKPYHLCGWSGAMLTCAMTAYCEEADFVWKEQDCLTFGDCIGQMYEELGDALMIFGSCKLMPAAQSLFLVKHMYIPHFIRRYLSGMPENTDAWLPEKKFARMASESPEKVKRFSFPFDRDRPLDITLPVWYAQKFTPEELRAIAAAGLIDIAGMPDVKVFSNTE